MTEPVGNPVTLVPQEAIDAAIRVINTDEMGGAFDNQEDYARQILEAAAPHIRKAATVKALRDAADVIDAPEHTCSCVSAMHMRDRADELEAGDN